ncbi:hypothetical protein GCM10027184_52970 [Saccharothrix stipae]
MTGGLLKLPPVSVGVRGGRAAAGSARAAEELVIESLALPVVDAIAVGGRISKFNLGELHTLVGRAELQFAFGLVDDRGRVASRPILTSLGWDHRTLLVPALGRNFVVAHAAVGGQPLVDRRMRVALPQAMLRLCGLRVGQRVLMVATGLDGVLVVHPSVNIAQMIRSFHDPDSGAASPDGLGVDGNQS